MKALLLALSLAAVAAPHIAAAQIAASSLSPTRNPMEQTIIDLSARKWQWMSEQNVTALDGLFDENAVFVHMGGAWGKAEELNVISSGSIQYKKADVETVSVRFIGNTAIALSKIRLLAVVGGNEVTNPFLVTEVFVRKGDAWKLGSLSFTRLLGS